MGFYDGLDLKKNKKICMEKKFVGKQGLEIKTSST